MRALIYVVFFVACGPVPALGLDRNCEGIKDNPGIYLAYDDKKPAELNRVNVLRFDPSARFYVVPDITQERNEGVWHVRVSTTARKPTEDNRKVKLVRSRVASACAQRWRNIRRDDEPPPKKVSFEDHDEFISGNSAGFPHIRRWHFDAGHPKCFNTADSIEPIENFDRYEKGFATNNSVASQARADTTHRKKSRFPVADTTSALVFTRSGNATCFSFQVPETVSFWSRWKPETTRLDLWRLPNRTTFKIITINWTED
jgi:hypothetical protein